jgi:hypothetical protein
MAELAIVGELLEAASGWGSASRACRARNNMRTGRLTHLCCRTWLLLEVR